ncbi:MAG: hypothetical protein QM610_16110 [Chitinophagaceae bacterium]
MDVNYKNIFNTGYTSVGVPKGDSVFVYSMDSDSTWQNTAAFSIPKGAIAVDGNIRRVLFLLADRAIVQEYYNCGKYCIRDTLQFSEDIKPISSKNWIRSIPSTESDLGVLDGEKTVAIYKDGGKWQRSDKLNPIYKANKTNPEVNSGMTFDKIYTFAQDQFLMTVNGKEVRFYPYEFSIPQLNQERIPYQKLNIDLPEHVLTAFVYDESQLGFVYRDRIEFYRFDSKRFVWEKKNECKPLYF